MIRHITSSTGVSLSVFLSLHIISQITNKVSSTFKNTENFGLELEMSKAIQNRFSSVVGTTTVKNVSNYSSNKLITVRGVGIKQNSLHLRSLLIRTNNKLVNRKLSGKWLF